MPTGKVYSVGCFAKLMERQRKKKGVKSYICLECGKEFMSDDNIQQKCGHILPKCCFCCEYSAYRYQECILEKEKHNESAGVYCPGDGAEK